MQDIDKLQTLFSWIVGIGVFIGTAVGAAFGLRRSRVNPNDDGHDIRVERARVLALQAQVAEERMRRDWEAALKATRKSFYDQSEKLTEKFEGEMHELEKRIHDLEMKSRP